MAGRRSSKDRYGRLAAALFALHTVLLFFPPLPPDVKGSLWDYVLAYVSVILAWVWVADRREGLATRWSGAATATRWRRGFGGIVALVSVGLLLRLTLPETFVRFSREEGVWEPVTMLAWITGSLVLLGAAREVSGDDRGSGKASAERKHLLFLGGLYAVLALEEIDYFGVFGGLIGRVDGIYVGSPHDLIRLWAEGLLTVPVALTVAAVGAGLATLLFGLGYLRPHRLLRTLAHPRAVWFGTGVGLVALALAGEAEIPGLGTLRTVEELVELAGALCLAFFAMEVAGEAYGSQRRAEAEGPL